MDPLIQHVLESVNYEKQAAYYDHAWLSQLFVILLFGPGLVRVWLQVVESFDLLKCI